MMQEEDRMNYQRLFLLCCLFIAAFLPQSSHACTTFCLDTHDELVVGKNFDWLTSDGLIIVNKRNVSKTAFVPPGWTG
jgi:penicillin V acylase-like amidase (Ntn superfamily)